MQTVVIDGQEFVLVPKEQLQPVSKTVESPLVDFIGEVAVSIDDGLATAKEREEAIQVHTQDKVVSTINPVRQAQGRPYEYRERFLNHEITPADIFAPNPYRFGLVRGYKDVAMIEADKNRPKEQQLFYGEGTTIEGSGSY